MMRKAAALCLVALVAARRLRAPFLQRHLRRQQRDQARRKAGAVRLPQPAFLRALQAPDENGVEQRWAVEWSGTGSLANQGVTRESLKVGDEVIIIGRPSRVPASTGR